MKRISSTLLVVLCLYPWIVGFTTEDKTSSTIIDLVFGTGAYERVSKDCNSRISERHKYTYSEIGGNIRYQKNDLVLIGKTGWLQIPHRHEQYPPISSSKDLGYDYANPIVSNETSNTFYIGGGIGVALGYFGIDVGLLFAGPQINADPPYAAKNIIPFGNIRVGFDSAWHFSFSALYNAGLYNSGGIFDMGFYIPFKNTRSSVWFGIGAGPNGSLNLILKTVLAPKDFPVALLLSGGANPNSGDDYPSWGITAGLRYQY